MTSDNQTTVRDIAINEAAFALLEADGLPLVNQERAAIATYESTMARLMPPKPDAAGEITTGRSHR